MATTASDTKVITGKVRFSYVHIFEKHSVDGGEEKYSLAILIPKSSKKTIKRIQAAVKAAKEQGKSSKFGGKIPPGLKLPLRDGDEERPDDEAYEGHYFINCTSNQKPGILDEDGDAILDSEDVYSGCYGRVSINFFPFSAKGNKGVACGLNNVQKLEDGEYLGGRAKAEDDFAEDLIEDYDTGSDDEDSGLLD